MVRDAYLPVLQGDLVARGHDRASAVDVAAQLVAAEHERPRVSGVGEEIVYRGIGGFCPPDPLGARRAPGQEQPIGAHRQQHLTSRAEFCETAEHGCDRFANCFVMSEHHAVVGVVVQPDWQQLAQLALSGFMPEPGIEARAK